MGWGGGGGGNVLGVGGLGGMLSWIGLWIEAIGCRSVSLNVSVDFKLRGTSCFIRGQALFQSNQSALCVLETFSLLRNYLSTLSVKSMIRLDVESFLSDMVSVTEQNTLHRTNHVVFVYGQFSNLPMLDKFNTATFLTSASSSVDDAYRLFASLTRTYPRPYLTGNLQGAV